MLVLASFVEEKHGGWGFARSSSVTASNFHVCLFSIQKRERIDQGGSSQVPIFLLTPPPVDEPTWAKVLDREASDRHNRVAREYGERAKKVGEELGCHVVDVFDLLGGTTDDYAKHLSDGLHLSDSGNKLLGEALLSLICKNYPQLAPLEHEDREKGVGMLEEEAHFSELI